MDDKKSSGKPVGTITAEQIVAVLQSDLWELAQKMAAAMNAAKAGSIIDDSEEPVRDAHADFRQQSFQKAIDLLASQQGREAFSPSASCERPGGSVAEQRHEERHTQDRQRRRRD
jgi:hypothetical protein